MIIIKFRSFGLVKSRQMVLVVNAKTLIKKKRKSKITGMSFHTVSRLQIICGLESVDIFLSFWINLSIYHEQINLI